MQLISKKISLLTLTLIGTATLTSAALTACSTTSSDQPSNTASSPSDVSTKESKEDGTMEHDMSSMDLGPADADYDLRFIDAMVLHHQGAVNMANELLSKSKRPEMKKLAQDIIAAQNREIEQMKQWRQKWYPKAASTPMAYQEQMGHMMAMTEEQKQDMMMSMDLGAADKEFDLRFINAMIPHHEGALTMAQDALSKSKRPEIKQLANNILSSQKAEIEQMNQWQQSWYKK